MPPLEIDNPFWQFSLRVYGAPGVAAECLDLQDKRGLDINVVLFAAWLGAERGVQLDASDINRIGQAVANWSDSVVRPLRAVRQGLKLMPEIAWSEVQALRKRVADTELFSEQIEQAQLYRLATDFGRPSSQPADAARRNVAAVLATCAADETAFPLKNLLAAI